MPLPPGYRFLRVDDQGVPFVSDSTGKDHRQGFKWEPGVVYTIRAIDMPEPYQGTGVEAATLDAGRLRSALRDILYVIDSPRSPDIRAKLSACRDIATQALDGPLEE